MKKFLSPWAAVLTFLLGTGVLLIAGFGSNVWPTSAVAGDVPAVLPSDPGPDLPVIGNCDQETIKDVYAAVLAHERYKNKLIVIDEMTNRGGTYVDERIANRDVPGADAETIADYEAKNREPSSLLGMFDGRRDIAVLTEKESKELFGDEIRDWSKFEMRFPKVHRINSLSDVGFNRGYTQALIYASYYCGPLCAGGQFFILRKAKDHWTVEREIQLWVS